MEIKIVKDSVDATTRRKRIAERCKTFSLFEQLGNIGSEVSRAQKWQGKDEKIYQNTVNRALELFDLTLDDPRWKGRKKEIARANSFATRLLKTSSIKPLLKI